MSLWGRWFPDKTRHLERPADLEVGDLIRFKLFAPGFLGAETFEVTTINTYEYEAGPEYEFVLKGSSPRQLYLTVDPKDDESRLRLSVRLVRDEIAGLFGLESFAAVFDQEEGEVCLASRTEALPEDLDQWCAADYVRTAFAIPAYFFKGDYRKSAAPETGGEGLDYYALTSGDEGYAVEIEVFDGEEDVLLTIIVEQGLIEELWPAQSS